jgi:hypothetical protein
MVLVELRERRRYELLSKRVVESRVGGGCGNPEARRRVAIDGHVELKSGDLLVARHVLELGQFLQRVEDGGRPLA